MRQLSDAWGADPRLSDTCPTALGHFVGLSRNLAPETRADQHMIPDLSDCLAIRRLKLRPAQHATASRGRLIHTRALQTGLSCAKSTIDQTYDQQSNNIDGLALKIMR